jgi:hypothetical protein
MTTYDIFNGDADGICSLLQLRLTYPCQSTLITGIKREINLLEKVNAQPTDQLNVLDISLDKNRPALVKNLAQGATIFYVDHHFFGKIPEHQQLTTLIDTQANICTSLLINQHLQDKYPLWAITGAFGDNLNDSAETLAEQQTLKQREINALKSLGILINYNGYGANLTDLHFYPDTLFKQLLNYPNPLHVVEDSHSIYTELQSGYQDDYSNISQLKADYKTNQIAVFILPNTTWARRISGVYSKN